jgi:hypothetical protein
MSVRTAITTEHLRRAVLAELASLGEASSVELARRLLGSTSQVDASRTGTGASGLAARGLAIRVTGGGWRITDAGRVALARLKGTPTPDAFAGALGDSSLVKGARWHGRTQISRPSSGRRLGGRASAHSGRRLLRAP